MGLPAQRNLRFTLASMVVVVALCCAACGSGADSAASTSTTSASSDSSSSPSDTASTPESTDSSGSSTTQAKKKNVIAWVLGLGAGSPPGPAQAEFAAYQALLAQRCDEALTLATVDGQSFSAIEGAATACLAATTGNEDQWAKARSQRDDIRDADLDCLQVGAFDLLDRLVAAHDANPGQQFEFRKGDAQGAPPCPVVTGLDPAQGVAGQVVTIKGRNLKYVKIVVVDFGNPDDRACFDTTGSDAPTIQMPAPQGATSARVIAVADPAQWEMGEATFSYESTDATTDTPAAIATSDCP